MSVLGGSRSVRQNRSLITTMTNSHDARKSAKAISTLILRGNLEGPFKSTFVISACLSETLL